VADEAHTIQKFTTDGDQLLEIGTGTPRRWSKLVILPPLFVMVRDD